MNKNVIIIGVIFAISLVFEGVVAFLKNKRINEINKALYLGKYEQFDQLMEEKASKFALTPFNYYSLKLSRYIMSNDLNEVRQTIRLLQQLKLKDNQKEFYYSKAFYYFIGAEQYDLAKKCYKKLRELQTCTNLHEIEIIYDIYVEKGNKYFDELNELYDKADDNGKINYGALIAKIYENTGDKHNAQKYLDIVKELIENNIKG